MEQHYQRSETQLSRGVSGVLVKTRVFKVHVFWKSTPADGCGSSIANTNNIAIIIAIIIDINIAIIIAIIIAITIAIIIDIM